MYKILSKQEIQRIAEELHECHITAQEQLGDFDSGYSDFTQIMTDIWQTISAIYVQKYWLQREWEYAEMSHIKNGVFRYDDPDEKLVEQVEKMDSNDLYKFMSVALNKIMSDKDSKHYKLH